MDRNRNLGYKQLDANSESNSIHTAEVSKTTKGKKNKEEGSNTKKRTTFMSRLQRNVADVERGLSNYLTMLETDIRDSAARVYHQTVHSGGPIGYAPDGQNGGVGYAPGGQNGIVGYAPGGQNGPVGYAPGGQIGPVGYAPCGQNGTIGYAPGSQIGTVGYAPGGQNGPVGYAPGGQNGPVGYAPGGQNGPVGYTPGGQNGLIGYAPGAQNGGVGYTSGGQNGPVGFAPVGQNVLGGYAPGGQHGPVGYAPGGQSSSGSEDLIIQLEGEPHRFSYHQLSVATGGFREESKLGRGGFGSVYRGILPSGIQVAVKQMNHDNAQSQGLKEFKAEVDIISQLRHRNLIKLLGWCEDSAEKEYMLVYELMPNGSLDDLLFKPMEGNATPSWPQRFKILTGTADALAYLHQGLEKQVLHRDIKCSNIMLDREWNARLGDFGIAKLQDHEGAANTTNMAGTMGYIAPEVFIEGRFNEKTDVFAFGVVVLESACGRRVLPRQPHELGLVYWVRQSLSKGALLSTVDKQLSDCDMHQMKMVLMIGLACCQNEPRERPLMRHVAQMLAGEAQEELAKLIEYIERKSLTNWVASVDTASF